MYDDKKILHNFFDVDINIINKIENIEKSLSEIYKKLMLLKLIISTKYYTQCKS